MKKVILFLFLLLSVQSYAQIKRTAVFDFTNPTALSPSITPEKENAQNVIVTDKIFKSQGVSISFSTGEDIPIGARIQTTVYNGNTSYYLRLSSISEMTFGVEDGATLNEIKFSDETIFGGLYLKEGEKGSIDPTETYKKWEAGNANNVGSVTFRNSDKDSQFQKIYVTYTEPSDVLSPSSTNIPQGGVVESFENFTLNFSSNMEIANSNGITLSNGKKTWNLSATTTGGTITLSAPNIIAEDGTYTINIPARCFKNSSGYENKTLSYTFTINTPKNTLNYESVTPNTGAIEKLSSGIIVTFPTYIKVNEKQLVLQMNGNDLVPVKIAKSTKDSKSAILTFDGIDEGIKDKGTYTITIPENTITNLMESIYNPTFTLSYEIGGTTPDPDPTPDPKPEESESMKLAKQLVALEGVGYPADNSESRATLKQLTEAETTPSDEDLNAAISKFYSESNVQMPEENKWYLIANVDSKGNKRYFSCKDNAVVLTTQADEATAFEANDNVSFKNIDGKYLYTNGVTDEQISLKLEKFAIPSIDAKATFGTFSIYGFVKRNKLKQEVDAYALVDCENNQLATDETIKDLQFDNNLSSAFMLIETSKPEERIKTVETAYTITPDVVETGKDLTLTFTGIQNVTKAENIDAYLANSLGNRIESVPVTASASQSNQFTISLSGFDNGDYQVVLPEGSFLYEKDGKTVQTQLIKKSFTIGKGGSGDDGNFNYTYNQVIAKPSVNNYIMDTDLNHFTIRILNGDYTGLVADPNKTVRIAKYNNNQTMATGHFEASTENEPGYTIIKLVLDSPITEGSFAPSLYAVIIEEGTFGDANFGKYLNDKTSVSAKDCKVNRRMNINYNVDNSIATDIEGISTDTSRPSIIYDLMGRRVKEMTQPGIYIVNGKKVIKK